MVTLCDENVKIECAHKHFKSIGVDFAVATDAESMISELAEYEASLAMALALMRL